MSNYRTVEEYARKVNATTAGLLASLCSKCGPGHPTTLAVLELVTESAAIVNGAEMQRELEGGINLAQLSRMVQPETASHSETPFEND